MLDYFQRIYDSDKKLQEIVFEKEIWIYNCCKRLELKSPHTVKTAVEQGFWAIHDDFFNIHTMEDTLEESLRVYEEYLWVLWDDYTFLRDKEELKPKEQELRAKLLSKFKCYDFTLTEIDGKSTDLQAAEASETNEELRQSK